MEPEERDMMIILPEELGAAEVVLNITFQNSHMMIRYTRHIQ